MRPSGGRGGGEEGTGIEAKPSEPAGWAFAADPFPTPYARLPELGDEVGLASEWAVPWSDLMMVMFVLFVVLFVYQAAEREVTTAFRPDLVAELRATPLPSFDETVLYQRSLAAARLADLDDVEVVLQEDRSIKVSVHGPLLFELGQAELLPETRSFLDRLAEVLASRGGAIEVVGHTDNFPISSPRYPTNWELSAARAASVARHLIRRGPVDPARFTIAGRSMYAPAAPNSSAANKALNRRVEIVISPGGGPVTEELP